VQPFGGHGLSGTGPKAGGPHYLTRFATEQTASVVTGGHLVLAGIPEAEVALDLARHVVLREVSLSGVYGRLIDETWHTVGRLLTSDSFDLSPLIAHEFALADFEAAFACASSGKAGTVVFRVAE
jgi:threonine 3-dehydrogenase